MCQNGTDLRGAGDPLDDLRDGPVEKLDDLLGRQRRGEEPALRLGDAVLGRDQRQLLGRLDALDDDRKAQFGAELGDAAQQHQRTVARLDPLEEGAVDLDLVERQALQVAEARVAGAEIVERDAHAEIADLVQEQARRARVLEQHRLGDFDLEPARVEAGFAQHLLDRLDDVAAAELAGRQVDGHAHMVRPRRARPAGLAQHPFAEIDDQAHFLGDGNELGRRDHAAQRVRPAQKRLAGGNLARLQIEQRLVEDLEGVVGERVAKVELKAAARVRPHVHLGLEEAPGAALVGLGPVERHVGDLEQVVRPGGVVGRQRDADAGADDDLMPVDLVGLAERGHDAPGQRRRFVAAGDRRLHDDELVAAEARDDVGRAHQPAQAIGHGAQEHVAARMAERVVDLLELVEVDEHDGARLIAGAAASARSICSRRKTRLGSPVSES